MEIDPLLSEIERSLDQHGDLAPIRSEIHEAWQGFVCELEAVYGGDGRVIVPSMIEQLLSLFVGSLIGRMRPEHQVEAMSALRSTVDMFVRELDGGRRSLQDIRQDARSA